MSHRAWSVLAVLALVAGCASSPPPPPRAGAPAATAEVADGTVPSADGVPIHYRAEGRGETALVFVHGWSCDGGYWKNQVPFFAERFRVVTLDLAGHGSSGTARKSFTVEAYAEDVKAVVERLGLRRVVLIVHSMSGPVTVEAARRMPERVVALVPVDTLHDITEKPDPKAWEEIANPLRVDFRKGTTEFVRQMFPKTADPALVERVAADMASAPPEVAIATFDSLATYDIRPALAEIHVPIRCINSDRWPTRLEENRRAYAKFDAVILPGLGHFPMLEAPLVFNEKLGEVLRDLLD
jgi:pimeloyl-ACP methyl ester carboxylesterase